jgi:hypothetical protein
MNWVRVALVGFLVGSVAGVSLLLLFFFGVMR